MSESGNQASCFGCGAQVGPVWCSAQCAGGEEVRSDLLQDRSDLMKAMERLLDSFTDTITSQTKARQRGRDLLKRLRDKGAK